MAAEAQADFQKAFEEQAKWGCIHGIDDVPRRRRRKKTAKRTAKCNTKLRDWQAKEKYLNNTYSQISPQEFYTNLGFNNFSENFSICVMHSEAQKGKKFHRYEEIATMLEDSMSRRDAYVYPASYYHSFVNEKLLHAVSCLYIDLDYVKASDLRRLCQEDFYGHRPTYLVNSGNGVHLVYELIETQPAYDWAKFLLRRIHTEFLQMFKEHGYKDDLGTGLSHAYRIVGSKTKLGQTCTAYRVGNAVSIDVLADSVGIKWQYPQARKYKAQRISSKPNGGNRFYNATIRLIEEQTVEGHRYNSMFALTCVGYKCGLELDDIRKDVIRLANRLELPEKEAEHALSVCDPQKAITVRAETLENWIGANYERKTKRNGRTRAEHLARVAEQKVQRSEKKIADYLQRHPNATQKEIAQETKMDRKTVRAHLAEVRQKLADMAEQVKKTTQKQLGQKAVQVFQKQGGEFIAYILPLKGELGSGVKRSKEKRLEGVRFCPASSSPECPD